jgi:hypothetical protein
MNHRISTLLIACVLMAQAFPTSLRAEFFKIEGISACLQKPKDGAGIYTDQYAAPLPPPPPRTKPAAAVFQPSVVVSLTTHDPIAATNTYVHGYFYDERGQLTRTCTNPAVALPGKQSMPVFFHKEAPAKVFFQIPKELLNTDWKFVAVFGDKDEASAAAYPSTKSPSSFTYPEKKLVETFRPKEVRRPFFVDPLVEYVAKSSLIGAKHPKVTLFLRMPKGITNTADLKGVLVISVIWTGIDVARTQMKRVDMEGDYQGLFKYANDHKLAIIAWGGPGHHWDPSKNYDAMADKAERALDQDLDEVADTWEKGVKELIEKYHIPPKDYLLWGMCRSAQWAHRLCLRKPDYFLGCYMLIPGSFDKPTPEASKVLWCLCTGELYGGYENALKWYKECRALYYPMIFKAYEGLGHSVSNRSSREMAFKFFDFALTQKDARDQYDKMMESRIDRMRYESSGQAQGPWPEVFKHPPYYGDIVNQEVYPSDQVEMIPAGFRTPLPTKELADYWLTGK